MMEEFDFDKKRTKINREYKKKKFNTNKTYEQEDSIQKNMISNRNLQDAPEETEVENFYINIKDRLSDQNLPRTMENKTPLKYDWIYWGYKEKSPYYKKNLKVINSFATAEEFVKIYRGIQASHPKLVHGDVFCVFKKGIMPLVDDPGNEHGGEWMISFERDNGLPADMNKEWLTVLWTVIFGEFGDDDSGICGVDIDIRGNKNKDIISVWTADWNNRQQLESIRAKLVEQLNLGEHVSLSYQTHH